MYRYLKCIRTTYQPMISTEATREELIDFCWLELIEQLEKIADKEGIVTYEDGFAITVALI